MSWFWSFFATFHLQLFRHCIPNLQQTGKNTYFNVKVAHSTQNTTKVISLDVKNLVKSRNICFLKFYWSCERSARVYSSPTAGSTGRKFFVRDARRILTITLHWIKIKWQKWYHRIQNLLLYSLISIPSAVLHKIHVRE